MKTIEDAKCDYCTKTDMSDRDISIEQKMNAFDAGVEFAQRWIPIEEELPKFNDTQILVKTFSGRCLLFTYINLAIIQTYCITHWRLLNLK